MASDTQQNALDTQNRQYAFMQKIMMLAKLWCDHAEGFESGLRTWVLDVEEWERASGTALADAVKYTVMMNMAPIFLRNSLQLGTYASSAALRTALLQWCHSSPNLGANSTVSAGNGTSADDDRMQVDSLKKGKRKGKGKHQNQKGNRTTNTTKTNSTDINTRKNCGRTGHWAKDCWRSGGGAYDNSTSNKSNTQKGKSHKKRQRRKHTRFRCGNEAAFCNSLNRVVSFTNTEYNWRTFVQFKRRTVDHGCDNQFRVYKETSWCRVFAS